MKKKIGLALGSGGARGVAHIGVLKGLENIGIEIDCISGSSAGSLVGGMYAAGMKIGEIERVVSGLDFGDIWKLLSDPIWGSGLIKGQKMMDFLDKYIGGLKIEDLKIPYCAVATDINTAEKVTLNKGDLVTAIRASCSVPFVFEPFKIDSRILVDGGLSSPVPVNDLGKMGAEVIIAVNLDAIYFQDANKKHDETISALAIVENSYQILRYHLAKMETSTAEVTLEPLAKYIRDFDFSQTEAYIKSGEEVVEKNKDKILSLVD